MTQMVLEIKSKRRLLFIVTQSELGGAQRFLFNFIGSLDKDQYGISVATGATGDRSLTKALNESYNISPYSLDRLHREGSLWQDLRALFEIRSFIRRQKPDTIFLLSSKAGFIGSLAAMLVYPRPKVIYRIGGWSFNDPVSKFQKKFRFILEKISAGWKDVIIVNNKYDYDQAIKFKISPRKEIALIHNGLNPYNFKVLDHVQARQKIMESITAQSGRPFSAKYIIGSIANLYPAKDIATLIESVCLMAGDESFVFCVIGDGPMRENLELRIKNLALEKKIFLLGQIQNASELLPGFDVFVLTSAKEGFPWSLLEAMAAKLPVIATRVGAVSEMIQDGLNGYLVDPGRPDQIVEAINKITKRVDQGQSLGIEAHQTVLHKFNDVAMNPKVESLL